MVDCRTTRFRRILVAAIGVVAGAALILATDLFQLVVRPLVVSSRLEVSDALVVFGGGLRKDGALGASTEERVRYAAELYHQGYAGHVLLMGGYRVPPRFEESAVMAESLVKLGVPRDRIHLDRRSRNTYENAKRTFALCSELGFQRVILVTSPYHMRRAWMCLKRYPLTVLAAPVQDSEAYKGGLDARLRALDLVLHEYGGLISYWWRGWI